MTCGRVSLIGAGPGDPEFLTLKAAKRLAEADLVLFDALVSPAALALAPHAQRFCVGKRARRHGIAQETTHRLMIRAARRGKRVVRLKGGDPFVLGRGGEEALALAAAGVPFEIVPGVSAATAAPTLAGIPVTHRGIASGFVVVTGHDESAYRPVLEAIAVNSMTIVVLMGLATRAAMAALLMKRGWPRDTPAAVIVGAATSAMSVWLGPLGELGAAPVDDAASPGTIVIGQVVSIGSLLSACGCEMTGERVSPVAGAGEIDSSERGARWQR